MTSGTAFRISCLSQGQPTRRGGRRQRRGGGGEGASAPRRRTPSFGWSSEVRLTSSATCGGTPGIELHARPFRCEDLRWRGARLRRQRRSRGRCTALSRRHGRSTCQSTPSTAPISATSTRPRSSTARPVAVAISSTGAGPVLAQKLRARIEAMLPVRLGALASLGDPSAASPSACSRRASRAGASGPAFSRDGWPTRFSPDRPARRVGLPRGC